VRFLRLAGRGARDTFDQFLPLILFSLTWWVAVALVVTGPPATATLFAMADPRRQSSVPEWSDAVTTFRQVFLRSWGVALWTIPLTAILLWNLLFFGGTDRTLAVLAPLWTLMILLLLILAGYAQAATGTLDVGVRDAFRAATFLLVSRPLTSLALFFFLVVLLGVMTILVVPLILIGPGLIASIVNRFVLAGLDIEVIDPNRPTPELSFERQQSENVRDALFQRARRGGSRH
jgi:uncharacterized membrane protein YesL